jgi:hypothetical protein
MPKFIEVTFMTLAEVQSTIGKKERIYTASGSPVQCTRDVIGVTETYQAQAAGFKPSVKIKVREGEYSEAFKGFSLGGTQYKVIRTQNAAPGFLFVVGEALAR